LKVLAKQSSTKYTSPYLNLINGWLSIMLSMQLGPYYIFIFSKERSYAMTTYNYAN
jgi:hypothetical protein